MDELDRVFAEYGFCVLYIFISRPTKLRSSIICRQSLTIPLERLEGQATPGDEDESRDTVSDNLDVDFTTSVKKLPVIYPKGRERLSSAS